MTRAVALQRAGYDSGSVEPAYLKMVGLAVVLTPVHHPLHTAERVATLDLLSGGRVELGVGRSGHPFQLTPFGVSLDDSRGMWNNLAILPKAWTEEVFRHQGNTTKSPHVRSSRSRCKNPIPPSGEPATRKIQPT